MQPAGHSKAPVSLLKKANGSPMLCRDRTWALSSMGQGKDWDRGSGRASWGALTGSAAPRQEAASETPKQLCSEVLGRNNIPGGGTGPWCSSSSQLARLRCTTSLSFCAMRAAGAREEAVPRLPGWAPSGLESQSSWAPESPPAFLCKAQLWASTTPSTEAGAGLCMLEGGDPWSKS